MSENSLVCKPNKKEMSYKVSPEKSLRICFSWVQLSFNTDDARATNKLLREISLLYIRTAQEIYKKHGFVLRLCPDPLSDESVIDKYTIPFNEADFIPSQHADEVRTAAAALHPDTKDPKHADSLPVLFCPMSINDKPAWTFFGRKFYREKNLPNDPNDGWGPWELSYVVINGRLISPDRMTLAHELIHGAGRREHFPIQFCSCNDARTRQYIPIISAFDKRIDKNCSDKNILSPCTNTRNCVECLKDPSKMIIECESCTLCLKRNSIDRDSADYLLGITKDKAGAPGYFCR